MRKAASIALSKVPEVTLVFWIIKIAATTLGETGGDSVSMSLNLGYAVIIGNYVVAWILALVYLRSSGRRHDVLASAAIREHAASPSGATHLP